MLWVLKKNRINEMVLSFSEHPKQMLKQMDKLNIPTGLDKQKMSA